MEISTTSMKHTKQIHTYATQPCKDAILARHLHTCHARARQPDSNQSTSLTNKLSLLPVPIPTHGTMHQHQPHHQAAAGRPSLAAHTASCRSLRQPSQSMQHTAPAALVTVAHVPHASSVRLYTITILMRVQPTHACSYCSLCSFRYNHSTQPTHAQDSDPSSKHSASVK